MNTDARRTLYGGSTISLGLIALGAMTDPLLSTTGTFFAGATLALTLLCDRVFDA